MSTNNDKLSPAGSVSNYLVPKSLSVPTLRLITCGKGTSPLCTFSSHSASWLHYLFWKLCLTCRKWAAGASDLFTEISPAEIQRSRSN